MAAPAALVASATIEAGSDNAGPVVSWTVTVKVAVPEFPAVSVAVHVTVVEPMGYAVGWQGADSEPSTSSTAVPANAWVAPADDVASRVAFPGGVTTGGVVSGTCTRMIAGAEPSIWSSASTGVAVTG
jgi:hypothetical protein